MFLRAEVGAGALQQHFRRHAARAGLVVDAGALLAGAVALQADVALRFAELVSQARAARVVDQSQERRAARTERALVLFRTRTVQTVGVAVVAELKRYVVEEVVWTGRQAGAALDVPDRQCWIGAPLVARVRC